MDVAIDRGELPCGVAIAEVVAPTVRSEYLTDRLCRKLVLMDQPSESVVASTDVRRLRVLRCPCDRRARWRPWDLLGYPLVRAVLVVVLGIAVEDAL